MDKSFRVEDYCRLEIFEKLGPIWKFLGRNLKIKEYVIRNIEVENPNNPPEQAYQLLHKWCEIRGSEATLEELNKALIKIGCWDIAESLFCDEM